MFLTNPGNTLPDLLKTPFLGCSHEAFSSKVSLEVQPYSDTYRATEPNQS